MAESRCPESGVEMETKKTEIAMGIALKVTSKKWEKNGKMTEGIGVC